MLLALGSAGHRVVVFEGHDLALRAALKPYRFSGPGRAKGQMKAASVLIVDDGMIPFLPSDWLATVAGAIEPGGRVLVHRRADYQLVELRMPEVSPRVEPGPGMAYIDGLLTIVGRGPLTSVTLTTERPLPRLTDLTDDPESLAYVSRLPAHDQRYGSEWVIGYLLGLAGHQSGDAALIEAVKNRGADTPAIEAVLRAKIAGPGGEMKDLSFVLRMTKLGTARRLQIQRSTAPA
jgi:hypothetical protein